jgi:hypothetical protein
MWLAVDIDNGVINKFQTLREGVKYYSDSGRSKRLSKGVYEVTSKSEEYIKTTFLIHSMEKESAEKHGFGWVFEEQLNT